MRILLIAFGEYPKPAGCVDSIQNKYPSPQINSAHKYEHNKTSPHSNHHHLIKNQSLKCRLTIRVNISV